MEHGEQAKRHSSFISPFWDFVFVGGLTLFIFPVLALFQFDTSFVVAVSVVVYGVSFFINNPHFMYSYQLLYSDFREKVGRRNKLASRIRYLFSGVIVPFLIIGFYIFSYFYGLDRGDAAFLGYAVNVMFFLVGWHYVKQGYGVLITLSVKKRVFFSEFEKKMLLYNGYILWIATWLITNDVWASGLTQDYGVPYRSMVLPFNSAWASYLALFSSAVVFLVFVLRANSGRVAWNAWLGYFCALYAWLVLVIWYPAWLLVVPALHSLQYLLFVGKLSFAKRYDAEKGEVKGFVSFLAIGGVLGVMGFWLIPYVLDRVVPYDQEIFGEAMFMMMCVVFINVHHYFIDFAIWRKDNPEMKYLYN